MITNLKIILVIGFSNKSIFTYLKTKFFISLLITSREKERDRETYNNKIKIVTTFSLNHETKYVILLR